MCFSSYKLKHVSRLLRYRNVSVQEITWTRGGCCWKDRPLYEADSTETPQDSAQQTIAHAIHIEDWRMTAAKTKQLFNPCQLDPPFTHHYGLLVHASART